MAKRRTRWTRELADLRRQQREFIDDLFDRGKPATRTELEICLALIRAVDSIRTSIEEQTGESDEHDRSCR